MLYEFTLEEELKINELINETYKNFYEEHPNETKEKRIEFHKKQNIKLNEMLDDFETKHFEHLNTSSKIINDAKKIINDAILFEFAYIIGEKLYKAETDPIDISQTYIDAYYNIQLATWRYRQYYFKTIKGNKNLPKIRILKSGMQNFIEQIAIPKHIAALEGTPHEAELKQLINNCLDNSQYIIDDRAAGNNTLQLLATEIPKVEYIKREVDLNKNNDVAMANLLITSGINTLNASELKILRFVIMQSKIGDTTLYEYEISVKELVEFFGIDKKHLYKNLDKMTDHIQQAFIKIKNEKAQSFIKISWVDRCDYSNGILRIKLAESLKPYILGLKNCFSKIKIEEYTNYESKYTIIIRELLEAKMGSEKPYADNVIEISISVEELKRVTNTAKKYKSISLFKTYVLDVAINEINKYPGGYHITAKPYKNGRSIEGYYFCIESQAHYIYYNNPKKIDTSVNPRREKKKSNDKDKLEQLTLKDIFNQEF